MADEAKTVEFDPGIGPLAADLYLDVYVIENAEHGEVLVPAIKECIRSVDIEKGQMMIHLMDGLI